MVTLKVWLEGESQLEVGTILGQEDDCFFRYRLCRWEMRERKVSQKLGQVREVISLCVGLWKGESVRSNGAQNLNLQESIEFNTVFNFAF